MQISKQKEHKAMMDTVTENSYGVLKQVKINGMWGEKNIHIKLMPINLFIGINGSGKTTLIKIIEAVAGFEPKALNSLKFNDCTLHFDNNITIYCKKFVDDDDPDIINFKIKEGKETIFDNDIDSSMPKLYEQRRIRRRMPLRYGAAPYSSLDKILKKYVKISWISVDRNRMVEEHDEYNEKYSRGSVDNTLNNLITEIQAYKAVMESQEKEIFETFRNQIFELMLYDEGIDTADNNVVIPQDDRWVTQLNKAFGDLNLRTAFKEKIDKHVKVLKTAFSQKNTKSSLLVLPLFNRTQKIINFSTEADNKRQEIRKYFRTYLQNIESFIGKNIEGIHYKDNSSDKKMYDIQELSSGEKQILILLTEAFLQRNEKVLFIADEPELSLHIKWQKDIVRALRELNPNAQIIFATHSPEVVALWEKYAINMENIINKGE